MTSIRDLVATRLKGHVLKHDRAHGLRLPLSSVLREGRRRQDCYGVCHRVMSMAAVALFAVAGVMAAGVVEVMAAAKPIAGVSCRGSFFVKTPDNQIHWVNPKTNSPMSVYARQDRVWAMAQCGTGVVSIFKSMVGEPDQFEAFYSPDCMDIGVQNEKTKRLYSGRLAVLKIQPNSSGVELKLSDASVVKSDACSLPGR